MKLPLAVLVLAVATASPAMAQMVMKTMPPAGTLKQGQIVLVDNGKCPKGQVLQVTGGYFVGGRNSVTTGGQGSTRKYACVPRP